MESNSQCFIKLPATSMVLGSLGKEQTLICKHLSANASKVQHNIVCSQQVKRQAYQSGHHSHLWTSVVRIFDLIPPFSWQYCEWISSFAQFLTSGHVS